MKLFLDQNLSPRALEVLERSYPGSIHVRDVNMHDASDQAIWDYAAEHGLTILTKDADFHQMSFLFGHPPKVVWIRRGNCSTDEIIELLLDRRAALESFHADEGASILTLE